MILTAGCLQRAAPSGKTALTRATEQVHLNHLRNCLGQAHADAPEDLDRPFFEERMRICMSNAIR
jgi:hypothetical protein